MTEVDKKREATASIRGYIYQIDAALKEILNAEVDDLIVVEGMEDYDKYSDGEITYSQVKYFSSKSLTDAVLREPLHKLFLHFHGLSDTERLNRKYVLYGHFAEVRISVERLTNERFKELMEFSQYVADESGGKVRERKSLLDGIAVTDGVIGDFCNAFKIELSEEFSEHRAAVIAAVRKIQNVSLLEAEGFHYPRAFDYIATMATNSDHNARATTRRKLQEHLKGTIAVHRRWLMREKSVLDYTKHIRRLYFEGSVNSNGVARVFAIEAYPASDIAAVCDQLRELARKWSSAAMRRLPDRDRHAPFILVRGVDDATVVTIKDQLFETGVEFVDGYPYRGSPFRNEHITTAQTRDRQIALRFVGNEAELEKALASIGRAECRIYDFFNRKPLELIPGSKIRMISIPIEDISMISKIV